MTKRFCFEKKNGKITKEKDSCSPFKLQKIVVFPSETKKK